MNPNEKSPLKSNPETSAGGFGITQLRKLFYLIPVKPKLTKNKPYAMSFQ
jgi:hypothetical protein